MGWKDFGKRILDPGGLFFGGDTRADHAEELYGGVDPGGDMQRASFGAERFGVQGQQGYTQTGLEARGQRDQLRRMGGAYSRLASGQDSVSAEQLRQGLQQGQAAQQSMAAGAAPQNQAMAARTAALGMGRLSAGMAGQQAAAGLQERQQAMNQQMQIQGMLQQGIQGQRGQELQAALGGQQNALGGYGGIEQNRTARYGGMMQAPTQSERLLGAAGGVGGVVGAFSDRRLKKDIRGGEKEADALLKALKAHSFRYKDEKHGKGDFVGIMAQDLERTKAGRAAVIDTPEGKMVHGARLATALAATLPGLDRRLAKLEGKGD